jgi:serine/threonine protein kinase
MVDGGYEMSPVGTKLFMAPEVRAKKTYGLPADVYSYGVVLWQVLSLASPRDGLATHSRAKIEEENLKECWLPICSCWPDDLQELVRVCLASNPRARPSMTQVRSILDGYLQGLWSTTDQQRRKRTLLHDSTVEESHITVESKTSLLTQEDL